MMNKGKISPLPWVALFLLYCVLCDHSKISCDLYTLGSGGKRTLFAADMVFNICY